jgi:signal transduction histidine kinase
LLRRSAARIRERQRLYLIALDHIGQALHQSLDLDTALNRVLEHVLEVMRLESGDVWLIQDGRLVMRASCGVAPRFVGLEHVTSLGQCVCGQAAECGELIAVEDLSRAPACASSTCTCQEFRAILSVPVRAAEQVIGVLHVASNVPRRFDTGDRALLSSVSHQVGAAVERAQLRARLKALSQELEVRVSERVGEPRKAKGELARKADALHQLLIEELRIEEKTRLRIAHDLHDGVQQLIIGALFETQAAREAMAAHPELAGEKLALAQELLQRIGVEMRHAIFSLRPLTLDTHGLATALREGLASLERVSSVKYELQVEGAPRRFNSDAEVAAFRIVQEALNNVESHAHARHACVAVHFGIRELQIEIADDGQGFDVAAVTQEARTQLGLFGMRERAESVGGSIEFWSKVGEGTRVMLALPLC